MEAESRKETLCLCNLRNLLSQDSRCQECNRIKQKGKKKKKNQAFRELNVSSWDNNFLNSLGKDIRNVTDRGSSVQLPARQQVRQ